MSDRKKFVLMLTAAAVVVLLILSLGLFVLKRMNSSLAIESENVDWNVIFEDTSKLPWWLPQRNLEGAPFVANTEKNVVTPISTDEYGFRGSRVTDASEGCRVLCLGDSTTFGLGVLDNETWPTQLEDRLRMDHPKVEVINAGLCGYTALQGLGLLEERCGWINPDVVVITFGFNDQSTWFDANDLERAGQDVLDLLAQPAAYRAADATDLPEGQETQLPRLTQGQFVDVMLVIVRWAQDRGARCLLLGWPSMPELGSAEKAAEHLRNQTMPYEDGSYVHLLPVIARISDSVVLDLFPHVAGHDVLHDLVHYNPLGCSLVADAVASRIRAEDWLHCE
jgi:lysophospholipase L1-like esterase